MFFYMTKIKNNIISKEMSKTRKCAIDKDCSNGFKCISTKCIFSPSLSTEMETTQEQKQKMKKIHQLIVDSGVMSISDAKKLDFNQRYADHVLDGKLDIGQYVQRMMPTILPKLTEKQKIIRMNKKLLSLVDDGELTKQEMKRIPFDEINADRVLAGKLDLEQYVQKMRQKRTRQEQERRKFMQQNQEQYY